MGEEESDSDRIGRMAGGKAVLMRVRAHGCVISCSLHPLQLYGSGSPNRTTGGLYGLGVHTRSLQNDEMYMPSPTAFKSLSSARTPDLPTLYPSRGDRTRTTTAKTSCRTYVLDHQLVRRLVIKSSETCLQPLKPARALDFGSIFALSSVPEHHDAAELTPKYSRPVEIPVPPLGPHFRLPLCHPVSLIPEPLHKVPPQLRSPWRQRSVIYRVRLTARFPFSLQGRVWRGVMLEERFLRVRDF